MKSLLTLILVAGIIFFLEVSTQSTTSRPTAGPTTGPNATTDEEPLIRAQLPTKYNYMDVMKKSLLYFYAQRSGKLPANDNPIPYRSDSALGDVGQNGEDLTGGYYDDGGFIKSTYAMAGMTTVVAWSLIDYPLGYTSAGQLTTAQNMIKWSTDYLIKAHVKPNKLYAHVGDTFKDRWSWGRPEQMTLPRPSYYIDANNPGSDLAGETAAALAAASIVFAQVDATYSALCLSRAKELYTFATQNLGIYSRVLPASIINEAGYYNSSGYVDELAWAAIWLYRATKNDSYLSDARVLYLKYNLFQYRTLDFNWDNKTAGVQLLLAKITNDPAIITYMTLFCDAKVSQLKSPKGLLVITKERGSLGYAANAGYICLQTADIILSINYQYYTARASKYRVFGQKQIHYALGDTGRSFVGGFGINPPVRMHHRSSSCPNMPWTCDWKTLDLAGPNPQILHGGLVGGPDIKDVYQDNRYYWDVNEPNNLYNAGFQAAVAVLQTLAVNRVFN